MGRKLTLNEQAQEIIRRAEESGVQSNYFFVTTFERYRVQLEVLDALERTIRAEGPLVTKEYVKGRGNLYANPALSEYNRTTDSANKTVATLLRILKEFDATEKSDAEDEDPLLRIINGGE